MFGFYMLKEYRHPVQDMNSDHEKAHAMIYTFNTRPCGYDT